MKKDIVIYDHEKVLRHEYILPYRDSLHRWFYVPTGPVYTSSKPGFLSFSKGFILENRLIQAILLSRVEISIRTTNADAVITNFYMIPRESHVKGELLKAEKPFILPVRFWFFLFRGYRALAKKLEDSGASGIFVPGWLPYPVVKKLSNNISLPVISAAYPALNHILSKIDAGAYAICLPGKHITKNLIERLHESCPRVPIIAYCGKSKDTMLRSLKSGADAVIYRPCIPLGSENIPEYPEIYF